MEEKSTRITFQRVELARSENQVVANNNVVPQYWLIYWGILDFIGVIWLNILALEMGEMDIY